MFEDICEEIDKNTKAVYNELEVALKGSTIKKDW
jgi:hypothetical protein